MQFIQAKNYTPIIGRPIDLIVIHTMEAAEKPGTALAVAKWFASPTAPKASAHYCIDRDVTIQCVRDEDIAWAAPGANANGIHIEHAGYALQSVIDWYDEYSLFTLSRSAALCASLCSKYNIPINWLEEKDLLAGKRGITGHGQVSRAFKKSNHWDPGPNFPVKDYLLLILQCG